MRWTTLTLSALALIIAGATPMAWKSENPIPPSPSNPASPPLVGWDNLQQALEFQVQVTDSDGKPIPALITDWTGTEIWEASREGMVLVRLDQAAQPLRIAAPGFITETFTAPLQTSEMLPATLQIRMRRNPLLADGNSQG